MKKIPILLFGLLLLASVVSHLAPGPASGAAPEGPTAEDSGLAAFRPAVLSAPGEPLRILTLAGEELELGPAPARVLPTNAGIVDFLTRLIAPRRLVALPAVADSYSSLAFGDSVLEDRAGWDALPRFVDYRGEVVFELAPDLVLASPWQSPETTSLLRSRGVPVLLLPVPKRWDEVLDTLDFLGRLFATEERAEEVRADLEARRAELTRTEHFGKGLSALSYVNFGSGGSTAGTGTTMQVVLELAGLRNASAEAGIEGYGPISTERLLALDPGFVVVSRGDGDGDSPALRFLRESPGLAGLRALRDGRILELPSALASTTSIRMLDAAEALSSSVEAQLARRDAETR